MKKISLPILLFSAFLLALSGTIASAEGTGGQSKSGKLLDKTEGPWKASCFVDASSPAPYCRIMVVHIFKMGNKGGAFAQFGPAFDRDATGFIVASYNGFKNESHITVGVDDNPPINMPAPLQANHIVAPANIANKLIEQMSTGKTITVSFKMSGRGHKELKYPLQGFKALKKEVTQVLAKKN